MVVIVSPGVDDGDLVVGAVVSIGKDLSVGIGVGTAIGTAIGTDIGTEIGATIGPIPGCCAKNPAMIIIVTVIKSDKLTNLISETIRASPWVQEDNQSIMNR